MASQHNRPSSYKALIEGNQQTCTSIEQELAKKVFGDEPREKKPHNLPSEEQLNEELRVMKVKAAMKSSIAGASSKTFEQYRKDRRVENNRLEGMFQKAAKDLEQKQFREIKEVREEVEREKTNSRASKRQKKKDNKKKRDAEYKESQKVQKIETEDGSIERNQEED